MNASTDTAQQVRYLNWRWSDARKRANNALGPTAAQSAQRRADHYEAELREMGAQWIKGRWQLPA